MGYIAPVKLEEANQYQLRTIQNEHAPITWDRVYRVQLHKRMAKHQEFDDVFLRKEQQRKQMQEEEKADTENHPVYVPTEAKVEEGQPEEYAEITGKGRFFSESI